MTKQIIRIELSTDDGRKLRLAALIAFIAAIEKISILRLEVKELKK